MITALASAIQEKRSSVRVAASNGLLKVLKDHGDKFSSSMWTLIFCGVVSPIFDDVRHLWESNDKNEAALVTEWASTTGVNTLQSFVDVFIIHSKVSHVILDDLLGLIRNWILQDNESIAREGMSIFARLIMKAGEVLSKDQWFGIIKAITKTFDDTMPYEIVGANADKFRAEVNEYKQEKIEIEKYRTEKVQMMQVELMEESMKMMRIPSTCH